jgi:phosphatidylglycerophosphate synthase
MNMEKPESNFVPTFNPRWTVLRLCVPSIVSSLRLAALPFLLLSLGSGQLLVTVFMYFLVISSDVADGFLARKLRVSSAHGAAFDSTVDFSVIGSLFLYFGLIGFYPIWVFAVIVFMFSQFVATSFLSKAVYDPLGKYYGSLLYGAIGLTILFNDQASLTLILFSLIGVTVAAFASRIFFLWRKRRNPPLRKLANDVEEKPRVCSPIEKAAHSLLKRMSEESYATNKY